jgi:phosphoribosyl 1,2-cyclic phosphodiesterase
VGSSVPPYDHTPASKARVPHWVRGWPALNLTAREAGEAAAAAGARRLLLTHFWPDNDRLASRAAAAAAFGGEILIADEGLQVPLG